MSRQIQNIRSRLKSPSIGWLRNWPARNPRERANDVLRQHIFNVKKDVVGTTRARVGLSNAWSSNGASGLPPERGLLRGPLPSRAESRSRGAVRPHCAVRAETRGWTSDSEGGDVDCRAKPPERPSRRGRDTRVARRVGRAPENSQDEPGSPLRRWWSPGPS